ncbi:MAG TPA: TatD family hydrolase [Vicinamibacterales bacterium]|nr:TatD family hydrolase [Vicinamibacterales bacterium]
MIVDSHCHLADAAFAGDREAVVARARAAGVSAAICILAADADAEVAAAREVLRPLWPELWFATGVHPHGAGAYADEPSRAADRAREAAAAVSAVALGEIGLDYHYDFAPTDVQQQVFAAQVGLAGELGLPVVIHTREASADTEAILREVGAGRVRGVMHCFTGTADDARRALDLGFWISWSGILTFPRAADLRAVAAAVPLDRLLIETDAPYLAPVPHRGQRNEPAYVVETLRVLAGLHQCSVETLAQQIRENLAALLGSSTAPVAVRGA